MPSGGKFLARFEESLAGEFDEISMGSRGDSRASMASEVDDSSTTTAQALALS